MTEEFDWLKVLELLRKNVNETQEKDDSSFDDVKKRIEGQIFLLNHFSKDSKKL